MAWFKLLYFGCMLSLRSVDRSMGSGSKYLDRADRTKLYGSTCTSQRHSCAQHAERWAIGGSRMEQHSAGTIITQTLLKGLETSESPVQVLLACLVQ